MNTQPNPIAVGQVIYGENCYLIVTAVKEAKVRPLFPPLPEDDRPALPDWMVRNGGALYRDGGVYFVAFANFDIPLHTALKMGSYKALIDLLAKDAEPQEPKVDLIIEESEPGRWFFANAKCKVTVDLNEKSASGKDLTDPNNEPTFYNTTSRSIKKALQYIKAGFNENTSFSQAKGLLSPFIGLHTYCAMD